MWLFLGLFIVICLYTYVPLFKWKKRPPGPWVFPFMGSIPALGKADANALEFPYRAMHRLSQGYGPIMSMGLGQDMWVILTGLEEIKQFSMMDETVARPNLKSLYEIYSFDRPLGVIFPDGPLWKEQRKFMMRTLREFGLGKQTMEDHIQDEIKCSIQFLREQCNENANHEVAMQDFFNLPCLNVIWRLVCGRRFDYGDKRLAELIEHMETFTMEQAIGPIAGISYLKYIPPFSQIYKRIHKHMGIFKEFLSNFVQEEKASLSTDFDRGYIDSFLRAQARGREAGEYFSDQQLVISVQDFFTGGSGTMSKTLAYAILFMVKYPEVQERARKEIQDALGSRDEVTLGDRAELPFIEAIVMEVQRLSSVLPIAPPRVPLKDVMIGDHMITQGTQVQINLYSLHRNQEHWGDPDSFRPDRFINPKTGAVEPDEWLQPFGYGKRKCLGETVAKHTVLLFLANFLLKFKFSGSKLGDESATLDPVGGLTIGPKKYMATVQDIL
uniref:Cytochrome P450 CYP3038A1 n=1 Tax=Tigriopus kingsejongensis TaxID=1133412 RepID=A0A2H4FY75_9MAXI|nr:cytochrome P450 CYP3038A1 [Tigriopus kingsejongensis]|eukprot:maker-scaffold1387_size43827-snap-gene-0.5 protein:Tk06622 transcript:maker-scaffold1387_size43827-snap-gene-0.5-mRNA-1 annotation:"cytochrome p450"